MITGCLAAPISGVDLTDRGRILTFPVYSMTTMEAYIFMVQASRPVTDETAYRSVQLISDDRYTLNTNIRQVLLGKY